jgi:Domain of unknown function (DUF4124)
MRHPAPSLWLALALVLLGTAARAELFRCTGPDGKTIFTDQKQNCPGAEPSEPTGVVHRAETPESVRSAPDHEPAAASRDPNAPQVDSEAAQWKQKKLDVERQIAKIHAQRDVMDRFVSHCNRPGRYVTTRDDAGIQQVVSCSDLKRQFDALGSQEAAARDYLATGLPEECRRAGCLPGWLR